MNTAKARHAYLDHFVVLKYSKTSLMIMPYEICGKVFVCGNYLRHVSHEFVVLRYIYFI